MHVVADAAYASRALRGLPAHVTVIVRMRANAAVQGPRPPRTGKRGRPRQQGDRLGTLAELAAGGGFTEITTGGEIALARVIVGQWYPVFGAQPVQIVLARRPDSTKAFDIALVSTDLDATPAALLERYRSRSTIETCFQDAKQSTGVGEARNRTPRRSRAPFPSGSSARRSPNSGTRCTASTPPTSPPAAPPRPGTTTRPPPASTTSSPPLRREIIRAQFPAPIRRRLSHPQITPGTAAPATAVS